MDVLLNVQLFLSTVLFTCILKNLKMLSSFSPLEFSINLLFFYSGNTGGNVATVKKNVETKNHKKSII